MFIKHKDHGVVNLSFVNSINFYEGNPEGRFITERMHKISFYMRDDYKFWLFETEEEGRNVYNQLLEVLSNRPDSDPCHLVDF